MAHSRSALKRWRQSLKRRDRNRSVKSRTRTLLNKAISSIGSDSADEAVKAAVSALDDAAQKGVIHGNAAARSKSRLLKRYNLATASAVAAAAGTAPAEEKPAEGRTRRSRSTGQQSTGKTTRSRSRKSE